MQRFSKSTSWEAATDASLGYDKIQIKPSQPVKSRGPLSGNQLGVVAAFGSALVHLGITHRSVRVVDFGGAEGRHAHLVAAAFPQTGFDWTVVELSDVVESMKDLEHPGLSFTDDLDQALKAPPDIVFASGALNYVPEPVHLLNKMLNGSRVTVLSRLPLWPITEHQVAVQRPQRRPIEVSYPTWFFSEGRLISHMEPSKEILLDFLCPNDRAFFAGHYRVYRGLVLTNRSFGESIPHA